MVAAECRSRRAGKQLTNAMSDPTGKISREELYQRIWSTPFVRLAKELGCSYTELIAICTQLNLPRPAGGYWYRLAHGGASEQEPLPAPAPGMPAEIPLGPRVPNVGTTPAEVTETEPPANDQAPHKEEETPKAVTATAAPKAPDKPAVTSDAPAPPVAELAKSEPPARVTYTREQLYDAVWSTPVSKLAARLGISDVGLAKTCRRLGVPRPPLGYWAQIEVGKKLKKEPLPQAKPGQDRTVHFDVAANIARREAWAANNVLTAGNTVKPGIVELPREGADLHPLAEKHRRALEKAKPDALGFVSVHGKDLFWCEISQGLVPRFLRALDAIICELEDRDYAFESGSSQYEGLQIARARDRVELRWTEAKLEIEREPTNADKRRPSWTWQLKETKPSGALSVEVSAPGLRGRRKWTEAEGRSLEEVLGVVAEKVDATFRGFEALRQREAELAKQREENARRAAEREAEEDKKRAEAEEERKERERVGRHEAKLEEIAEARRDNLAAAAQEWIEAQGIAAFIDVCESRWRQASGGELSKAQNDWLEWARAEARRMEPFAKGYPDPAADGKLDANTIPVGGPYPEVKPLEQKAEPEAAPQVKTEYVQVPQPKEQFPFWLLHRRH
jgi:hypothetical protein